MSSAISLKNTTGRGTDAVLNVTIHGLMICTLLAVFALFNAHAGKVTLRAWIDEAAAAPAMVIGNPAPASVKVIAVKDASALSSRMQGALEYVVRRYRVSEEALLPVFEVAQMVGQERRIDPLLIVAIIGIESGFNPFAESPVGAQGLMQVIPRFHMDKLPPGTGERPFLDPLVNIQVGVDVLQEAIRRRGGLIAGLQYYAGASDSESTAYADKVLAEKARLEQAARRSLRANA
ncbi:MAG: transglycosylase SLT domain-containing protein [Propionivibrio sp.]